MNHADVDRYGRHSMENTPPDGPMIDEFLLATEYHGKGKHRLQQIFNLGDLPDLVYFNPGRGGFLRHDRQGNVELIT